MDIRIRVTPQSIEKAMRLPDNFIIGNVKVTDKDFVLFNLLDSDAEENESIRIKEVYNLEEVGMVVNNKMKEERMRGNSVAQELLELKTLSPELSDKIDKIIELVDDTQASYEKEMNEGFEEAYDVIQEHQSKIYELKDEIVKLQDRIREGA